MDERSVQAHLRVQLTLLGSGRSSGGSRTAPFRTNLRVAMRNFPCEVLPEEPLTPGGHAVHATVAFADPGDAVAHFPAGAMFELWEGGRRGYGMVLSVTPGAVAARR